MGGHKLTGLLDPSSAQDSATKNYVDAKTPIAVSAGIADAISATFTPTITALTNGLTVLVRAGFANATTTPTFAADATASKTIVKGAGAALSVGNIPGVGYWMSLTYDLSLDKWVLNNPTIPVPASPVPGAFKNLSIKVASNTTVNVAADYVTTTNGTLFQSTAVSSTINLGTSVVVDALDTGTISINSWYFIWVIAKADGTTKCVASLQSTANATFLTSLAAIASGAYTYYARIGAVQTINGSATLYGTWQLGRRAQYVNGLAQTSVLPLMLSGASGSFTAGGYTAVSTLRFIPPTASVIYISALGGYAGGTLSTIGIAPNNTNYTSPILSNPPPIGSAETARNVYTGSIILESSNIYYTASAAGGAAFCLGWEDNI